MRRRRGLGTGLLKTAARTAVIAGTAQSVSGKVARRQQQADEAARAQQPAHAPRAKRAAAGSPVTLTDELVDQLKKAVELRDAGVLSNEEFATLKARLLPL